MGREACRGRRQEKLIAFLRKKAFSLKEEKKGLFLFRFKLKISTFPVRFTTLATKITPAELSAADISSAYLNPRQVLKLPYPSIR